MDLQSSRQSIMRVNRQRQLSTPRSRRPPLSCAPCRRRKVKCDRRQPCNQCISHNMADLCYYQNKERNRVSSHLPPRAATQISSSPDTALPPTHLESHSNHPIAATDVYPGRKATTPPDYAASSSAQSLTRTIQSLTNSSFHGSNRGTRHFGRSHWALTMDMARRIMRWSGRHC